MNTLFTISFIQNIGWPEIIIALVVALLLFGRRLPEVGKYLGRSVIEFKKGIKGFKDEIDDVNISIEDQVNQQIQEEQKAKVAVSNELNKIHRD